MCFLQDENLHGTVDLFEKVLVNWEMGNLEEL